MKWIDKAPGKRRGKYRKLLDAVRRSQRKHPDKWAEIARYDRPSTASEAVTRLKKEHPDFIFRSSIDQKTRKGVLYAMFIGNKATDNDK